ncbi:endo-beta-N-acetylglucosaminidase [Alkalihalobacillus sp. 1P02AB]|uniref:endo-beta-N-acetylglucosaminidase n=1 Tax=Alkalihalobacillus sp. 1P02AB TaxID=3132260 RepID=UPI0039A622B9
MKKTIFLMLVLITFLCVGFNSGKGFAEQPESSYWYPETLLNWSPENDPNAKFNRSTVPLAKRETLFKMNDSQQSDAKLVALSALNPNTSGVPSQGGKEFFANTFSYWQYVDLMVYWAGSAGEGVITPPSADVIDASHKNGVPILGNVFFPPKVYGGKDQWVEEMLSQREDGSFPAADKLLEVAEYYQFDGWFINQETEDGTPETARKMQDFLIYLQENKPEEMHIMWYDSMIDDGQIRWQNYLTDRNKMFLQDGDTRVADSMFLNFWWTNNSQKRSYDKALEIGREPYDLYAGIDVEADGTNTFVEWGNLFPDGESPYASLGIYRPDWAFKSTENMQDFYKREQEFWVGQANDPTKTDENPDHWKGMAHYFTESTVINELPFITHFNTGSGEFFSINGEVQSTQSWNNRSLQDILPTWRWIRESKGEPLEVDFDWEESYYGGSSLKVFGELSKKNATHIQLYKTNLLVEKDTEIAVTYKTLAQDPNFKVGISFTDAPDQFEFFDVKKKSKGKWTTDHVKLKPFKGKNIATISLFFESKKELKDYQLNIGELKVMNKNEGGNKPARPSQLKISDVTFNDGLYANIALQWQLRERDVHHYEIYRHYETGEKEFIGAIPNSVFFIPDLKREGKENQTTLEVVTVNKHFVRSERGQRVVLDWPDYPAPKANFSVSKSVAAPGEEIQFFNMSSEVTESVEWVFEGGSPSASTEMSPIVTYEDEGTFPVKLIARNSEGEDILLKEDYMTISEEAKNLTNLALNQTATASGECAPSEGPSNAVDGKVTDNSKWCAIGLNHWLTIDLGETHRLAEFIIKHAEAGGEPSAFNTRSYSIEVSDDAESWREIVVMTNNTKAISEHRIPLTEARYVRLSIQQPTQGGDQATRIYEFEVHGF